MINVFDFLADVSYTRWHHNRDITITKTTTGLEVELFTWNEELAALIQALPGKVTVTGISFELYEWLESNDWKIVTRGPIFRTYRR